MSIQNEGFGTVLNQTIQTAESGGNSLVWSPDESVEGAFVEWSDVVAAVAGLTGDPTIKIRVSDEWEGTVTIPGGVWDLNRATLEGLILGDVDTDTDFRGYEDLLYVVTEGDPENPTWLKNCAGLKDMFFRASDYNESQAQGSQGAITNVNEGVVTFSIGDSESVDGPSFLETDVGRPIRIGDVEPYGGNPTAIPGNTGTFLISEVVDEFTIKYLNGGGDVEDANNGSIGWSKCTSVFISTDDDDIDQTFVLDNADFRYGGDTDWGSYYVQEGSSLFIKLTNAASIRWFSTIVDGFTVVQSDGSGCWVGSLAFAGNGSVYVYPMSGCQVRTWQETINSFTLNQPYTVFLPDNEDDWTSVPDAVHQALNELVQRVKALENP